MVDLCREREDCQVIVKVHPSFTINDYPKFDGPDDWRYVEVIEDADLYELIKVSDVCVTDYSTAGAEAVVMGKPLIVVNLLGKRYPSNNYDEYGVALSITRADQVKEVVSKVLDEEETRNRLARAREQFINEYNYLNDGQAAKRIVDLLADPTPYLTK